MDTLASPLVITKLHRPVTRPRIVPRTRLVERLAPQAGTSLVLICAPAGYGKSTLLAEWAHSLLKSGVAVAWYALDSSDDDPIPFGSYLVASLVQALGPVPELVRVAQLLRTSPESDLQRNLPAVINAVASSSRRCVLVLDDYHLIGAPAIHSALAFLLERLPENMHIAIGSRSDPPLPLARLRTRGKLLEIRAADLRFTGDETALFLNGVMQLDLSSEMVTTLEARTEGWIAGLQLAALAMQLPQSPISLTGHSDKESFITSFTGGHRYLVEYLLEEVISHQPEEVQSFLLSTSILERLCGSLCDAILGEPSGSEAVLAQLEQANLFVIALDDQGCWYRYHHLFRDFLQARLHKTQPERVAQFHRAASEWHAAHGYLREAVDHALRHAHQTQDWTYATALVEQHGVSMMLHSEFSTMVEWCAAFPEEVMRVHPALCLFQSNALVLGYRRQNRGKIEERLQQVDQAAATLEDSQLGHLLMGQAAATRTVLAAMTQDPAADPQEHFALAQRALDVLSEGDPARSAVTLTVGYAHMALHDAEAAYKAMEEARQLSLACHNYFGVVEAAFHQACLAHSQGRLRRAAEICRQGQADVAAVLAHPAQELPALACLDIALGCVLLEQDGLEDAEQRLLRGLDRVWGMNPYYQMIASVALFRLREVQGRSVEAVEFLTRLEETWPDLAFCARALQVMHSLRTAAEDPRTLDPRTLAGAVAWCQDFPSSRGEDLPPPGMGPFGAVEAYYLAYFAWARAQIAIGKAQAVWSYLDWQLALAEAHGLTNRVIELSLLEAQAGRAQGDDERTWAALERALLAAQPEGYVRIFDQGTALNRLLIEAASHGIAPGYVKWILAVIGLPRTLGERGAALGGASGELLSQRELEVLRLMVQGASNYEIAERLVITVGTVKSHVNHILTKLDARNRTEAVARARGLGLLEI